VGRVGSDHPVVNKIRGEMDQLQREIKDEQQRIVASYAREYQIGLASQSELSAEINHLSTETGASTEVLVTLNELENTASSLRASYVNLLQNSNELSRTQTLSSPILFARVITPASPQLDKDTKKTATVLAAGIGAGLLIGALASVAMEWIADVFRTAEQLKRATLAYSIALPLARRNRKQRSLSLGSGKHDLSAAFVLGAPQSAFAESIRRVRALVHVACRVDGDKVFAVVSSAGREGRTTIVTNLAALMPASAMARTLLIDADLARIQLTRNLAPNAKKGLLEALTDPSKLPEIVSKTTHAGVEFLPCVLSAPAIDSAELIGSIEMERLLAAARDTYDQIIIDTPPILERTDVKMIERFIDKFIFVVEGGKTKRRLVRQAFAEAGIVQDRLLCIILNRRVARSSGVQPRRQDRRYPGSASEAPVNGISTSILASKS